MNQPTAAAAAGQPAAAQPPTRTPHDIARDIARLDAEIKDLQDMQNTLKNELRAAVDVGWKAYADDGTPFLTVQPNRRFNLERATALLDPQLLELCRPDGYDPKKVKQYLPPLLVDQCMEPVGAPKVVMS